MGHSPELTRRAFLKVTGGAAALAVVGGTFEPGVAPAKAEPLCGTGGLLLQTTTTLEARHLRHIRQCLDGYVDTPWDHFQLCEQQCTRFLTDHELRVTMDTPPTPPAPRLPTSRTKSFASALGSDTETTTVSKTTDSGSRREP